MKPQAAIAEASTINIAELTLEEIPAFTWQVLSEGAESAVHPFHTPCIATLSKYGPVQRTVVLRYVDAPQRLLVCHTDRRASKAREIVESPRMSWHVYDRKQKLQIKLSGRAVLHTDDPLADACWERSAARARTCYNTRVGPGQPVREPPLAPVSIGSEAEEIDARSHFAAIACRVDFIDWLYLSGAGHRRALIEFAGNSTKASWVTP